MGLPPGFAPVPACSAKPGAAAEPRQSQFSTRPGPSGPVGIEILTQILRAGRALMRDRRAPRKGGRGKAVIGEQSSPLRRPPAAFWLLCRRGQSNPPSADGGIPCNTARRGRRALRPEKGCSLIAPSSVWPSASHLPPRGKAFAGEGLRAADSRPYRENSVEIPHLHKILRGS